LPLLPAQPALRLVEEPLRFAAFPCDTGDRDARPLPHVVVVELGDGGADAALQLRVGGAQVVPLLLQRMRTGKLQLAGENPDEAAGHASDLSIAPRAANKRPELTRSVSEAEPARGDGRSPPPRAQNETIAETHEREAEPSKPERAQHVRA